MGKRLPRSSPFLAMVVLGALAGCQWIVGIDDRVVDQAGFAADGSAPATDGGPDAPFVGNGDAGGLDGATSSDARFCARQDAATAALCDDFDDPGRTALEETGWVLTEGADAPGILDRDASASPPASMLLAYSSSRAASERSFPFGPTKSSMRVSAKLLVAPLSSELEIDLQAAGACTLSYSLANGDVDAYCPNYVSLMSTAPVPVGSWQPIVFSVTRRSGGMALHVEVGEGTQLKAFDGFWALDAGPFDVPIALSIGNPDNDGSGTLHVDDVLVETY